MAQIRVEEARGWVEGQARTPGDHITWIERLARLGFGAKGVVYMVIGTLALKSALGNGGTTTDSRGALSVIKNGTFGDVALAIIGIGLLGYTLWQFISAAKDTDERGSDAKGIALRIGQVGRAIAYGALGVAALRILVSDRAGGGEGAERWAARGLESPAGRWIVIAAGAAIAAYALYQLYRALMKDVRKRMKLSEADPRVARWVERLARFGIAARGIVFGIIGWLLIRAGLSYDPSQAGGIRDSLLTLRAQPNGALVLGIIAAGLVAYGLFQLANARYRRVRAA